MDVLAQAAEGFRTVDVAADVRDRALDYLGRWLTGADFAAYRPQLEWLIAERKWDALIDAFYQILPFGTGGRRGAVGIGPNRMNRWTLGASIQGHCEYLKEKFPDDAGLAVVVGYDVRRFTDQRKVYNPALPNPVLNLTSRDLARHAVTIYAANGIRAWTLPADSQHFLATPELSYTIRHVGARGGLNISASHNPPDDNGGKFYDERGGQPVPPDDQIMAELVDQVTEIRTLPWADAVRTGRVSFLDMAAHRAYIDVCVKQSLIPPPRFDEFTLVFTPLHGVGSLTSMEVLQAQGFRVTPVPEQMAPDGLFPNVTASPNPEVPESLDRAEKVARTVNADLVLATDPDADRLGGATPTGEGDGWHVLNGNEIAALLTWFKLSQLAAGGRLPASPVVITTEVTTGLVTRIARHFGAQVVDDLLVGFKYIADVLRQLEQTGEYGDVRGRPEDFVIATEESHGALLTAAIRDKDAGAAALALAEAALDQKRKGRTLYHALQDIYRQFGYFRNGIINVVMTGVSGKRDMAKMLDSLRASPPAEIAGLPVTAFEDLRDESGRLGPLRGDTDAASRNVLLFTLGDRARVALRPSGTEPKAKAYIEAHSEPCPPGTTTEEWKRTCAGVDELAKRVGEDFRRLALAPVGR